MSGATRSNSQVRITDFDPDDDVIRVDLTDSAASYSADTASLSENTETGVTTLRVLLTSPALPDQEMLVRIDATGLSWDDVKFVGGDAPTLLPVTA